MKKLIFSTLVLSQIASAEFTEYIYYPKPFSLHAGNVVINNGETMIVGNELPHILVNNFVNKQRGELMKPFSSWDPGIWTSLTSAYQNYGFAYSSGAGVGYGSTAVQSKGHIVGMHLNTFDKKIPTTNTASSLQYTVRFNNHNLWNTRPNDDLCMVLSTDIYSSYSEGSTNQAVATFIFNDRNSPSFFFNFVLYEKNRRKKSSYDYIEWDKQDTKSSIVMTYVDGKGGHSTYSSSMPGSNTTPYISVDKNGGVPNGSELYAACISPAQIKRAVADLKELRPKYYKNLNVSDLRLDTALVGPEIENSKGRGHMGMKVNEMWVVRRR